MVTRILEVFLFIVSYFFIGGSLAMTTHFSILNKEFLLLNSFFYMGGLLTVNIVDKYYRNRNLKLFGKINETVVGIIIFGCSMFGVMFLMW